MQVLNDPLVWKLMMTASSNGVEESRDFDLRRLTIDFHLLIFLFHEIDAAKSLLVMRENFIYKS